MVFIKSTQNNNYSLSPSTFTNSLTDMIKTLDSRGHINTCSPSPLFHGNCAAKVLNLIDHSLQSWALLFFYLVALINSMHSHNLCSKG